MYPSLKTKSPQPVKLIVFLGALFLLASCSMVSGLINGEPDEPASEMQPASDNDAQPGRAQALSGAEQAALEKATEKQSGAEIVWEAPKDPVDEFIIRYGYSKEKLDIEVKLTPSQIETFNDPQYGPVFRYVINDLQAERDVFVSLASMRQGQISPTSQVFEIKAQALSVTR